MRYRAAFSVTGRIAVPSKFRCGISGLRIATVGNCRATLHLHPAGEMEANDQSGDPSGEKSVARKDRDRFRD